MVYMLTTPQAQHQHLRGYSASDWIAILPSTVYTKNKVNQIAFYDSNKTFIGGLGDGGHTFTSPSNAYFVRLTVDNDDLDSYQLEKGNQITNTSEYQNVISQVVLPRRDNLYDVAKTGGNFKTINDGIYYLSFLNLINDVTLRINPGIYDEVITLLKGDKKISLIGVNKRDCIIINRSGDYYFSPLQPAGRNYFKNLSFIANNDLVGTLPNPPSYAVHSDYNFPGEMVFEDCYFESMQNAALGIGMFADQTMIFKKLQVLQGINL